MVVCPSNWTLPGTPGVSLPVDISLIAAACPALESLTLNSVVEPVANCARCLEQTQQLRCLRGLNLGGLWLNDPATPALAGMTRLQKLQLHNAPRMTAGGLDELTALTRLRQLLAQQLGPDRTICLELNTQEVCVPELKQHWRRRGNAAVVHGCRMLQHACGWPSALVWLLVRVQQLVSNAVQLCMIATFLSSLTLCCLSRFTHCCAGRRIACMAAASAGM